MIAWYHDFLVVLSLGSVALQLYVIALIWIVSPPAMSTYRYFLFLYTVSSTYVHGAGLIKKELV